MAGHDIAVLNILELATRQVAFGKASAGGIHPFKSLAAEARFYL